jgi:hypothetical protein
MFDWRALRGTEYVAEVEFWRVDGCRLSEGLLPFAWAVRDWDEVDRVVDFWLASIIYNQ